MVTARYLIACGGHGRVLLDALIATNQEVAGIVDPKLEIGSRVFGVEVVGDDSFLATVDQGSTELVNGIGSTGDTRSRENVFTYWTNNGFKFAGTIHPSVQVGAECEIDQSAQVMAGAVIQNRVRVGKNVVINTRASIDHDVVICDHVVISPGAIVSGGVKIGHGSFIGAGAVIIQGIEIGDYCVIGAGAVVRHNVVSTTTVVGNPATQLE